jgi:hypothetical protein
LYIPQQTVRLELLRVYLSYDRKISAQIKDQTIIHKLIADVMAQKPDIAKTGWGDEELKIILAKTGDKVPTDEALGSLRSF